MASELVAKVDKEELNSEHITFTPYGVEFTEDRPSIEEWHKAVLKVQNVHGMLQFYLGDLMVFADSEVSGWGQSKYDKLVDATGYAHDSLSVYTRMARRFSASFRESILGKQSNTYPTVSFAHFQIVAPLPDEHAKYFLEMVRDGRWTVSKLREEITRYRNGGELPDSDTVESETPRGYESFKQRTKDFFRGYLPNIVDTEYDEASWLLEVKEVIELRLIEMGVIDA